MDLVGCDVWELPATKFGNTEGGRGAQGRRWHRWPWCVIPVAGRSTMSCYESSDMVIDPTLRCWRLGKWSWWVASPGNWQQLNLATWRMDKKNLATRRMDKKHSAECGISGLGETKGQKQKSSSWRLSRTADQQPGVEMASSTLVLGENAGSDGLVDAAYARSLEVVCACVCGWVGGNN